MPKKKPARTPARSMTRITAAPLGGRRTRYKREHAHLAKKHAELGATDRDIAELLGVSEATVHRWKARHAEFCESVKVGKRHSDYRVESSLYRRATGYTYDGVKIMQHEGHVLVVDHEVHVPPDVHACIFWLKNRCPEQWREKHIVEHEGGVDMTVTRPELELTDEELLELIARKRAEN